MPLNSKAVRQIFRRLDRQIVKLAKDGSAENIHSFRTSSRRVEAVLEKLCPDPDRNTKKMLKLLSKLRKKVGKVRDLDVQIAALGNLKIAREVGQKAQLARSMSSEHSKRKKKFFEAFDKETQRMLRKRLKRASATFEVLDGLEPVTLALSNFMPPGHQNPPLNQKTLHLYRVAGKQARYLAELDGQNLTAKRVVANLKRMQDVIGDWHDWLQLSEKSAAVFGGEQNSALVAALRNIARAKFRHSLNVLAETRQKLSAEVKTLAGPSPVRKLPNTIPHPIKAAAA